MAFPTVTFSPDGTDGDGTSGAGPAVAVSGAKARSARFPRLPTPTRYGRVRAP